MITLTNVVKDELDYDDEIYLNPLHIVSMKRVSLSGTDDDDVVPATEIVMMSGEAIHVVEDPNEILRLCHGG
ncbi:MAG TPA: hypothetical protein VMT30_02585 [Candidatus Saccharimonadia bacterium]|nr:hypothetical protein [Candidatus Saccharimonadia bacterium]